MSADLFEWLVQYHINTNLQPNLKHLSQGRYTSPRGKAVLEGEENDDTTGCLILANGDSLVRRLQEEKIILDRVPPKFIQTEDYTSFKAFLDKNEKKDGAFVYDGKNNTITRISRFANHAEGMDGIRDSYRKFLPANFVYEEAVAMTPEDYDDHIGTKTDLSMVLPIARTTNDSKVNAYQVKRTAYGQTGLGKVTHFGPQGLKEEFFFHYDPTSNGPFIDEEHGIVGVYRSYERNEKGELVKVLEQLVGDPKEYFKL